MSNLVSSLQRLRQALSSDLKGLEEAEAANTPDMGEAFNTYVVGVIDEAVAEYDMDFEAALDRFFDVAASLEEDELLPPMPDVGDTTPENVARVAAWLGAAATIQLGQLVLASLEADSDLAEE